MDWTVRIRACKGRSVRTARTAPPVKPSPIIGSSTSAKIVRKRARTSARSFVILPTCSTAPSARRREATSNRLLSSSSRDVVPGDGGTDASRVERLERGGGPMRRQAEHQGRTIGTGQAYEIVGGVSIAVHFLLHTCRPTVGIERHDLLEFHRNMMRDPAVVRTTPGAHVSVHPVPGSAAGTALHTRPSSGTPLCTGNA